MTWRYSEIDVVHLKTFAVFSYVWLIKFYDVSFQTISLKLTASLALQNFNKAINLDLIVPLNRLGTELHNIRV